MNEKENLINSIDDKVHRLMLLKCDYCTNNEIVRFCKSDLEDKVEELSSIMNKYTNQCGIIILCAALIIGTTIFGTSFIVSRNVILSLSISIISLCVIWTFMKNHIGSEKIKCDIDYDELTEVNTVKKHYEFWDSTVSKLIEPLTNVSKTNVLIRPFTNMFISTSNYVTFKTRYYDNLFRLMDFYTKIFDDIWIRNKDVYAEEFVEYFVKNTSAWSCRKETYQLIMFNCTELTFTHLFLSIKGFDLSICSKNDIQLCVDEFMRCNKTNDRIDTLSRIDKILTFALSVDDHCQKKLDNINSICN